MTTATTGMQHVATYLDAKRQPEMAEAVRDLVNAHDKLVAACRAALTEISAWDDGGTNDHLRDHLREALAAAEGDSA